jgi:hypothetical protein
MTNDFMIQNLITTTSLIHSLGDHPIVWKLNKEYLVAVREVVKIQDDEIFNSVKFLESSIDLTTGNSYCVGEKNIYALIRC